MRLLQRVRTAARIRHLSRSTEEAYVGCVKRYVRFHDLEHPKRDILGQLERLRRQADAGHRIDAILLCWESSTPVRAFGDSLRDEELLESSYSDMI